MLEDKCTAYEMLTCYAQQLGASFAPYMEETFEIVLAGVNFYIHEGIRYAALNTIPLLFRCMKQASMGSIYIVYY